MEDVDEGGGGGTLVLKDENGKTIKDLSDEVGNYPNLEFISADGNRILIGDEIALKIFDNTGQLIKMFNGNAAGANLCVSENGKAIGVNFGVGQKIIVLDENGKLTFQAPLKGDGTDCGCGFSADGKKLIALTPDRATIYDLNAKKILKEVVLPFARSGTLGVVYLSDEDIFIADAMSIWLENLNNSKSIREIIAKQNDVRVAPITKYDNDKIVTKITENNATITQTVLLINSHGNQIYQKEFSKKDAENLNVDGNNVVLIKDGNVSSYDLRKKENH